MKAPHLWIKKKFGITSVVPMDVYLRSLARRYLGQPGLALANAAEKWYPHGNVTMYPVDFPYALRYLMVCYALPLTNPTQPTNPGGFKYPNDRLCQLYPTNNSQVIPLGIATDEPDNGSLDQPPISTNVCLLGGSQQRTCIGISDSQVIHGTLAVGSTTNAGYLTTVGAVPGSFWSPGLFTSDSEGLGAQVQFDPRVQVINVGVIT